LKKTILRILSKILFISLVYCQEIPNEFYQFYLGNFNQNYGSNWESNTIFGPVRYSHRGQISDSLKINARFGGSIFNDRRSLYAYGHFTFKQYFHGYIYPRIVDKPDLFRGFSGLPRDIERGGFSAGETDLSGISFENDWMIIQFGRGRQSWGAGSEIELAISEKSNSYDYGMLDLDFNKLKVRYFHGYLETDSNFVNRYITGRGIEWNNNRNLLLGISEIIIYSGKDRAIDFSYFNPMSTHLEIELNNRQNKSGTDGGNGVWQISLDYLIIDNLRFSCNYLFDEFIMDEQQKDEGKGPSRAYSLKTVYSPLIKDNSLLLCYLSIISVGTNTFRHEVGYNNFVQRNDPLGWGIGSDSREIKIGFDWLYQKKIITRINFGTENIGEKNFINNLYTPYEDYLDEPFPSGSVNIVKFISTGVYWWWKPNIAFFSDLKYGDSNKTGSYIRTNFGVNIYYGLNKNL
tara:strand:- start:80 stop:1462 length:1383 start_codon:yes stop_codon:yes gene_type:complete